MEESGHGFLMSVRDRTAGLLDAAEVKIQRGIRDASDACFGEFIHCLIPLSFAIVEDARPEMISTALALLACSAMTWVVWLQVRHPRRLPP